MFKRGCARASLAETGGAGAGQEVNDGAGRDHISRHLRSRALCLVVASTGFSPGINKLQEVTYQISGTLRQPKHTLIL